MTPSTSHRFAADLSKYPKHMKLTKAELEGYEVLSVKQYAAYAGLKHHNSAYDHIKTGKVNWFFDEDAGELRVAVLAAKDSILAPKTPPKITSEPLQNASELTKDPKEVSKHPQEPKTHSEAVERALVELLELQRKSAIAQRSIENQLATLEDIIRRAGIFSREDFQTMLADSMRTVAQTSRDISIHHYDHGKTPGSVHKRGGIFGLLFGG